jgi:hypothetical protein
MKCSSFLLSKLNVCGRQEWSYSKVDIVLDSESKSRGFESHYDQLSSFLFLFLLLLSIVIFQAVTSDMPNHKFFWVTCEQFVPYACSHGTELSRSALVNSWSQMNKALFILLL